MRLLKGGYQEMQLSLFSWVASDSARESGLKLHGGGLDLDIRGKKKNH